MSIIFRFANYSDIDNIQKIYSYFVEKTTVSFEHETPSKDELKKRIDTYSPSFPFIVCLVDGELAGYSYASKPEERAGYAWRAHLSIYVDRHFQRMGIATALYSCVMEITSILGYSNVYATIVNPNEKSEHFHKSMGFKKIACYNKTGYKLGEWRDVYIYEKFIGKHTDNPQPVLLMKDLPQEQLQSFLEKWQSTVSRPVLVGK